MSNIVGILDHLIDFSKILWLIDSQVLRSKPSLVHRF